MSAPRDCSHFIGLHTSELIELLCNDRTLVEQDRLLLRQLAGLLQEVYHVHFHRKLVALKNAYAPLDPDSDAPSILALSADQKQARLNELLRNLIWLLDRANFRHLDRTEMEKTLGNSSDFGIHMNVDFSAFEHVSLFIRGETYQQRPLRSWKTFYYTREVTVPIFRRLVLILKLRPHPRLGDKVDTEHVHLKLFKDIPRADADMLLPGARVKLKLIDRGKLGVGILSGVTTVCYRMAAEIGQLFQGVMIPEAALWGLVAGLAGYGYKSYADYHQTRQEYHLNLTQSLYFQCLDSNAGVLSRLFNEAEEQEMLTTLLAYYCLWRYGAGGLSNEELEATMEMHMHQYADVVLLCMQGEPLRKLARLGLVESEDGRHRAPSLPTALAKAAEWRDRREELPRTSAQSSGRF